MQPIVEPPFEHLATGDRWLKLRRLCNARTSDEQPLSSETRHNATQGDSQTEFRPAVLSHRVRIRHVCRPSWRAFRHGCARQH